MKKIFINLSLLICAISSTFIFNNYEMEEDNIEAESSSDLNNQNTQVTSSSNSSVGHSKSIVKYDSYCGEVFSNISIMTNYNLNIITIGDSYYSSSSSSNAITLEYKYVNTAVPNSVSSTTLYGEWTKDISINSTASSLGVTQSSSTSSSTHYVSISNLCAYYVKVGNTVIGVEDSSDWRNIDYNIFNSDLSSKIEIYGSSVYIKKYDYRDFNGGYFKYDLTMTIDVDLLYSFSLSDFIPSISGASDDGFYNSTISLQFNKAGSNSSIDLTKCKMVNTINGQTVSFSSTSNYISSSFYDGNWDIYVYDYNGFYSKINLTIDFTYPTVSGIENGKYYNTEIYFSFYDNGSGIQSVSLKNNELDEDCTSYLTYNSSSGYTRIKVSRSGDYTFTITDNCGNKITINFEIDYIAPLVNQTYTSLFFENTDICVYGDEATFNSMEDNLTVYIYYSYNYYSYINEDYSLIEKVYSNQSFLNTSYNSHGYYKLVVSDLAGNETIIHFAILTEVPEGTLHDVQSNFYANNEVLFTWDDPFFNASLNGNPINNGSVITIEGTHTIILSNYVGLTSEYTFTIDLTNYLILSNNIKPYYLSIDEISVLFLNIDILLEYSYTFNNETYTLDENQIFTEEGIYKISVFNLSGIEFYYIFMIDRTPPEVIITCDADIIDGYTNKTISLTIEPFVEVVLNDTFISLTENTLTLSEDGTYKLIITDLAGNTIEYIFYKKYREITTDDITFILEDGTEGAIVNKYTSLVKFNLAEDLQAYIIINGERIEYTGQQFTDGSYTLNIYDIYGNTNTYNFSVSIYTKSYTAAIISTLILVSIPIGAVIFIIKKKKNSTVGNPLK